MAEDKQSLFDDLCNYYQVDFTDDNLDWYAMGDPMSSMASVLKEAGLQDVKTMMRLIVFKAIDWTDCIDDFENAMYVALEALENALDPEHFAEMRNDLKLYHYSGGQPDIRRINR